MSALALFLVAFGALLADVDVSERPGLPDESWLIKAYYALALFVVGGIDLGTPSGGPVLARGVLCFVYFAAPLLFASAIFEALVRLLAP